MIKTVLGTLVRIIKLPIKIVLFPFRVLSAILSLLFYLGLLAALAGVIYYFVL